jgi:hypothetical protein
LPGAAKIETPDTDKDAALPAHRGAAAYVDGTERTFLDKYSDYMWGAILLLSGLGSAGAWLRSYLKRDEKAKSTALRDRVLALIAEARDGNSTDELDEMQREVDDILRETLTSYDDGALEEGDLSAFSLAFEQFQHAVVARHATGLPTHSCTLLARTFVRATVKPTMFRAVILFRCPHSMVSRAQITSTTWHSMS